MALALKAKPQFPIPAEPLTPEASGHYAQAAKIANSVMLQLVAACVPGADTFQLCHNGDQAIQEQIDELGLEEECGIALPTCIAVNNMTGLLVPPAAGTQILAPGDVVQIVLGVHIDGHIAHHGHTTVCGVGSTAVRGKRADVIAATHVAAEVVQRMMRCGTKGSQLTRAIHHIARDFGCHATEDTFSCSMRRFVPEADKTFLNRIVPEDGPEEFEVQEGDVFSVDIVMSTGSHKLREGDIKPSVYVRDVGKLYQLKMKTARQTFAEIDARFPTMPFCAQRLETPRAQLGIKECVGHGLLVPFAVRSARPGDFVARIRFTVAVHQGEPVRLCSHPPPFVSSEFSPADEELRALLTAPAKNEGPSEALPLSIKKSKYRVFNDMEEAAAAAADTREDTVMADEEASGTRTVSKRAKRAMKMQLD